MTKRQIMKSATFGCQIKGGITYFLDIRKPIRFQSSLTTVLSPMG